MERLKTPEFLADELPQDRALRLSFARLSAAVAELPLRYAPFFSRLSELWELPEAHVVTELARAKDPRSWHVTLVRGLKTFEVERGTHQLAGHARLLHFAPGVRLPQHGHRGRERVLVLEGSYADASGFEVHAGESQTMTEHGRHELNILGDVPCVAAVIEHGVDFGFVDLLGTWL